MTDAPDSPTIHVQKADPIAFHDAGKMVGRIFFDDGKLAFEGDMHTSARIFADELVRLFNRYGGPTATLPAPVEALVEQMADALRTWRDVDNPIGFDDAVAKRDRALAAYEGERKDG